MLMAAHGSVAAMVTLSIVGPLLRSTYPVRAGQSNCRDSLGEHSDVYSPTSPQTQEQAIDADKTLSTNNFGGDP